MKLLTAAFAGLAVAGWAWNMVTSYYIEREKEALKAELEGLKKPLFSQRQIITDLTTELDLAHSLSDKVKQQERQIAVLTRENDMLLRALDEAHDEIRKTTSKLENAEQKYNNLQERFENMKNKLIIPRED